MKAKDISAATAVIVISALGVVAGSLAQGEAIALTETLLLVLLAVTVSLLARIALDSRQKETIAALPPAERVSKDCGLSAREQEVLERFLDVRDIKTCAKELFIAPGTVKTHLSHIYGKTGVTGCHELLELCDSYATAA